MKLDVFPQALEERNQAGFFDDFLVYVDAQFWTKAVENSGTAALEASTSLGVMQLASAGSTTNSGAVIASTNAFWQLLAGQPFYFETYLQYAEQNTNQAGVAFGLSSVATMTGLLPDSDGALASSFTGAVIYKLGGTTAWNCAVSNGTTQTVTTTAITAGDTAFHRFAIEGRDVDGTKYEVTFFYDGLPMVDTTFHRPIKSTVLIASASAMKVFALMKSGTTGTNAETLNVDYIAAYQRRTNSF